MDETEKGRNRCPEEARAEKVDSRPDNLHASFAFVQDGRLERWGRPPKGVGKC